MAEQPTEGQVKTLKKIGYSGDEILNMTKQDAWKILNDKFGGKKEDSSNANIRQEKNSNMSASHSSQEPENYVYHITKTDKPHSYEFGKAGNRHKIYYNNVADLQAQMLALQKAGFIDENDVEDIQYEKIGSSE